MLEQNQTSAMVALLPTDTAWCKTEPAHLTLAYLGEIENLKATMFNEVSKDVASIAMLSNPVIAKVTGLAVLGETEKVDVFTIESTQELLAMRSMLEEWDTSDFAFNPHVTIGPEGSWNRDWSSMSQPMPMMLMFDRICVWWGDKTMPFWLRKY